MYYHVLVETCEKDKNGNFAQIASTDLTDIVEILSDYIIPYVRKTTFMLNGYVVNPSSVRRLLVKSSNIAAKNLADQAAKRGAVLLGANAICNYIFNHTDEATDITNDLLKEVKQNSETNTVVSQMRSSQQIDKSKVFIVHGHNDAAKESVARFIEQLGLKAIILHEQSSRGQTIIEKIESNTNVGFAIVIYTDCDEGRSKNDSDLQPRARQNVVFEHGYLVAKIGRENVCALIKNKVEKPSDIAGIVYVPMDNSSWQLDLAKELHSSGYNVDLNCLVK